MPRSGEKGLTNSSAGSRSRKQACFGNSRGRWRFKWKAYQPQNRLSLDDQLRHSVPIHERVHHCESCRPIPIAEISQKSPNGALSSRFESRAARPNELWRAVFVWSLATYVFGAVRDAGSKRNRNCFSLLLFLNSRFVKYAIRFKSTRPSREFFSKNNIFRLSGTF